MLEVMCIESYGIGLDDYGDCRFRAGPNNPDTVLIYARVRYAHISNGM